MTSPEPVVLFDGEIAVDYGFLWVCEPAEVLPVDIVSAVGGQHNGLCGAVYGGLLAMFTGLRVGRIPVRIEGWDAEPDPGSGWEEVVEVPFAPAGLDLQLKAFEDVVSFRLPVAGALRARWCASGMDSAAAQEWRRDGEPGFDRYLLQFWPSAVRAETVVKVTSESAKYWHELARTTPPPAGPRTRAERDEAERQRQEAERLRREEANRVFQASAELSRWDGTLPSDALRSGGGRAPLLARLDRDLAETIAALPADAQRSVAVWAARSACTVAGIADEDWIAAALTALDRGKPLPAPFDDPAQVWVREFPGPHRMHAYFGPAPLTLPKTNPRANALDGVLSAGKPDSAHAAFDAVGVLAAGEPTDFLPRLRALVDRLTEIDP